MGLKRNLLFRAGCTPAAAAPSTITGTKLDRLGAKLDKQVAVADLVLSSFLFKLTSTNYLDSCRRYVLLSNLVTGMV